MIDGAVPNYVPNIGHKEMPEAYGEILRHFFRIHCIFISEIRKNELLLSVDERLGGLH